MSRPQPRPLSNRTFRHFERRQSFPVILGEEDAPTRRIEMITLPRPNNPNCAVVVWLGDLHADWEL